VSDAVFEPSYETYEGERTSRARRLYAIARRGLSRMAGSTWFWVLFGLSLAHIAIRGVVLYVTGQVDVPPGTVPPEAQDQIRFTSRFLTDALAFQVRWVVTFVLVVVGAETIAEDLQAGGLTFYFTKPITKPGYTAGKLAAPLAACLLVTALPLLLLWVLGMAFTPEALYPDRAWLLPLALVAGSLVASAMTTLVVAGLSGLVGSSGRASVVWIALVFVLAGASRVAHAVTDEAAALLVGPYNAIGKALETLTGVDASLAPATGAWLTVAGWSLAGIAAIAWTFHRQEVAG
jgi:ABC-type transport system involved in multi-copper enzyme maturation permease subunit